MSDDRAAALFFELFTGLPRQGPGDAASTRRALAAVPDVGPDTRVLDLGCGTGAQTVVLAQHSPARIVAIDSHGPFVDALAREARPLGLEDRIDARVGDMRALEFAPKSFDLIWCEGAISIMGFEEGLRQWRPLLVAGGHMAVTEVCWTTSERPAECADFWAAEYPAIRDLPTLLRIIDDAGYEVIDRFRLPPSSWWDHYYRPLQQNVTDFLDRHRGESDAGEIAAQVQREIDVWKAYGEFYAYEFFVMRVRP
jgi:cyclopropane fatty-acyl-phospholipid synthase-like methyltransferase